MGIVASTSLGQLSDNKVLERFTGETAILDSDVDYWETLLTFSFDPPKSQKDFQVFYQATYPLLEKLVQNSEKSGNVYLLIKVSLRNANELRDESKCENKMATLQLRNALFMLRCVTYHIIQAHSEQKLVTLLDFPSTHSLPSETVSYQATPTSPMTFVVESSIPNGSGLKLLVHGMVSLLGEVPVLPFTYDVHVEAINLLIVVMSGQMFAGSNNVINIMMEIPHDVAAGLVQVLLQHFISQPLPPLNQLKSPGFVSSITSGILSLVLTQHTATDTTSTLALSSLLLLLILVHQNSRGYNPYRDVLSQLCDDHIDSKDSKESVSLQTNFNEFYQTICRELSNEQTTLLFYQLLHNNLNFASYIFSRSDIDTLLMPLLKQLCTEGMQPTHHSYMLLIILLMLSQDECFNKSIHEINVKNITWASEKNITQTTLGSLMVIVLVRTVHKNIQHIRDKFLHTNCLATLANMSSHFHSLSLEASEKIINLFRVLSKKYFKSKGEAIPESPGATPTSPVTTPTSSFAIPINNADTQTLEEILVMLLEIINSSLTYTLHVNPHFVYSLLYQREVFTPFHSRPGFIDLINNIEMVITYFASSVEKDGTPPYSAIFVQSTIEKYSKSWPRSRLRTFSELKFRYVEESQPEEFFIPYIWSLVQSLSRLYFDSSKIKFSSEKSTTTTT